LPGGQGNITDASDDKYRLIKGYGLKGGVLISLHWDDAVSSAARSQPFLRQQFASQATVVKVPEPLQTADGEQMRQPLRTEKQDERSRDGAGKKLPKWLKLPGKK